MTTRYPEIVISGPPREMGRQLGEAARHQIRGFAAVAVERVNQIFDVSVSHARQIADQCIPPAESYAPHLVEELRGVADSSGVSLTDLMLLQVRNQLRAAVDVEACTAVACQTSHDGNQARTRCLVGQNWDSDPHLDAYTIVLTRQIPGGPSLMNVTQAGLIGYIGLNTKGFGICLNTLPAPSREVGVPHYFLVRAVYECSTFKEAVRRVRQADRAVPANLTLATPEGPADLEITLDAVHVLRDPEWLYHTNHCLHEDLQKVNEAFPELIESYSRAQRIQQIGRSIGTVEQFQSVLRDHDNYPRSICRHPNDDRPLGFWKTVLSVVIDPAERSMWVSRGNPCKMPYEQYVLT